MGCSLDYGYARVPGGGTVAIPAIRVTIICSSTTIINVNRHIFSSVFSALSCYVRDAFTQFFLGVRTTQEVAVRSKT